MMLFTSIQKQPIPAAFFWIRAWMGFSAHRLNDNIFPVNCNAGAGSVSLIYHAYIKPIVEYACYRLGKQRMNDRLQDKIKTGVGLHYPTPILG
jgi:hypothetical protein